MKPNLHIHQSGQGSFQLCMPYMRVPCGLSSLESSRFDWQYRRQ